MLRKVSNISFQGDGLFSQYLHLKEKFLHNHTSSHSVYIVYIILLVSQIHFIYVVILLL